MEQFKKELLSLQSEREGLRLKLQKLGKFEDFGQEWESKSKELKRLDGLFFRQCEKQGFKLSKGGRLL